MKSVSITIPGVPPSLNRFLGRAGCWDYRTAKNQWTDAVMWAIRANDWKPKKPWEHAHVTITYFFPDNRKRDADNYAGKLLLDGLTSGGLIVDDDLQHITTTIAGDIDRKNPHTVITVREE